MKLPVPEGDFHIRFDCPRCQTHVSMETNKADMYSQMYTCPACSKWFGITISHEVCHPALWTLYRAIFATLLVDQAIMRRFNPVSEALQTFLVTDKYALAICMFVLGIVSFPVTTPGWTSIFLSLVWTFTYFPTMYWAWQKTGSSVEEEMPRIEDQIMLQSAIRARLMLIAIILPIGCVPLLLSGEIWALSVLIGHLGYYFVDSTHVPPSKRGVLNGFLNQKSA